MAPRSVAVETPPDGGGSEERSENSAATSDDLILTKSQMSRGNASACECVVCYEPMTTAVNLPCSTHFICEPCAQGWVKVEEKPRMS